MEFKINDKIKLAANSEITGVIGSIYTTWESAVYLLKNEYLDCLQKGLSDSEKKEINYFVDFDKTINNQNVGIFPESQLELQNNEVIIYQKPLNKKEQTSDLHIGRVLEVSSRYHLIDCLRNLQFSRPADNQIFLDNCIKQLKKNPEQGVPFS